MGTAEQKTTTQSDIEIVRMTEHDLLEVVEIEEQSGLSRWGWAAYYAELQGGNRELMLVAKPLHARPLDDYHIAGVKTNVALHRHVLQSAPFRSGDYTTQILEEIGAPPKPAQVGQP